MSYNTNGQSASNTSDTQHIPPMHLDSSTFLEPADMDATIEVETPPLEHSTVCPPNAQESAPTYTPSDYPPLSPTPAGDVPQPQQEAREPYYTHPLPCSYPILWQSHQEECRWLRGVLLAMFTVLILAMVAVLFSLMIVVAAAIVLCVVVLLINLLSMLRKDNSSV